MSGYNITVYVHELNTKVIFHIMHEYDLQGQGKEQLFMLYAKWFCGYKANYTLLAIIACF